MRHAWLQPMEHLVSLLPVFELFIEIINLETDGRCLIIFMVDGGRSVWEPVWRACMERIQGQKPHPNKPETPVQPRSGILVF